MLGLCFLLGFARGRFSKRYDTVADHTGEADAGGSNPISSGNLQSLATAQIQGAAFLILIVCHVFLPC